jgi:hypothetical protein
MANEPEPLDEDLDAQTVNEPTDEVFNVGLRPPWLFSPSFSMPAVCRVRWRQGTGL